MIQHTVQQGECLLQIADSYGFLWMTLWDHPDNSELKALRGDPNVLMEGDIVVVPDPELRTVDAAVEKRHRFRRKGVPGKIKIRFTVDGEPRANVNYVLEIDGTSTSGTTDSDGYVEMDIPAAAREGSITLDQDGHKETYQLQLGHLDPLDTDEGCLQRLGQLAYVVDEQDPSVAIKAFQQDHELELTGELDQALRDKLKEVFGQ